MAFKKFYHNSSSPIGMEDDIRDTLEAALAYAGFDDLIVNRNGSDVSIYQQNVTAANRFISFNIVGDPGLTVYMSSGVSNAKIWGLYISIIATKHAVALLGCINDGITNGGVIITKDTAGNYVMITNAEASITTQSLDLPRIAPRGSALSAIPTLPVSTVFTFAVTTLCNFPTVNDGSDVRYIENVYMCVTGQLQADGDCTIDGTPYYCIGGRWYLKDSE